MFPFIFTQVNTLIQINCVIFTWQLLQPNRLIPWKSILSFISVIITLLIRRKYKRLLHSVNIIQCEINKTKDYTFTLLAKFALRFISFDTGLDQHRACFLLFCVKGILFACLLYQQILFDLSIIMKLLVFRSHCVNMTFLSMFLFI